MIGSDMFMMDVRYEERTRTAGSSVVFQQPIATGREGGSYVRIQPHQNDSVLIGTSQLLIDERAYLQIKDETYFLNEGESLYLRASNTSYYNGVAKVTYHNKETIVHTSQPSVATFKFDGTGIIG
ncbi:hypothetical protein_gp108 [Bacillus phage vB_BceM_WH1]|nr:hypothetical protein_gp108 [Bacillus phage vB_BceM_WH1]